MKILLIGPYPPPHGGVSVHIYEAAQQLRAAGIECRVVNIGRSAPPSADYISIRGAAGLLRVLLAHARAGWTLHFHTNGHNDMSWLTALLGGVAGLLAPAAVLTLHSGMMPGYVARGGYRRFLARACCALYSRLIAVSPSIRESLLSLGVPAGSIEVQPAFLLPTSLRAEALPPALAAAIAGRWPLLSTALFFRPEYGFELLVEAVARLRPRYPDIACVVMGSGEPVAVAEARQFAGHAGLDDAVLFAGNVGHEESLALQAASDVFVRPTLTDGDAISVREAVALGVAAVASDVGTRPPEAILFPAGNAKALAAAIERALTSPRRAALTEFAPPQAGVQRLIEIYRQAAAKKPPVAASESLAANMQADCCGDRKSGVDLVCNPQSAIRNPQLMD